MRKALLRGRKSARRDLARVRGIQRRADDPRDEESLRLEALPIPLLLRCRPETQPLASLKI